jgi:hypothetical protein
MTDKLIYGEIKTLSDDPQIIQIIDKFFIFVTGKLDDNSEIHKCDIKPFLEQAVKQGILSEDDSGLFWDWLKNTAKNSEILH